MPEECNIVTGDYGNEKPKFAITDTELCVPVVTLSAQDNEKILQQLKKGSKKTNQQTIRTNITGAKPIFKAPN